ncbi:MAG TPA: RICIN domain-containing protein [Chitinophaga sp.]|uniref:RICIN domain-containing protein n=1 Tax=Chitinophaga sp. TaxID=1869181 RepID=UPI002C6D814A|nr:RICIN domain-containing protein [Chitinophaga sp.]HVI45865.1 RICIN domain-containing protein [Chitinophaga sp.]
MAFKNLPNQRYYLIAKHSGKALGFANTSLGCRLTQMTLDPDNENQKFTLVEGSHFYWILPGKDRYIAVNNASPADGAELIQWHWEPDKANLQFHLDPVADGYYRIRALHSNKFIDVVYARKEDATRVEQIQLSGTDNQLFKLMPVIGDPAAESPISYSEATETLRTVLLALISKIPDVGGISAVIGFFWTSNNTLANLWDQLKSYIDIRILELLEQKQIEELRDDLTGVLSNAKTFDGLSNGTAEKGAKLISTLTYAEGRRPHFLNKKASVLPYLVGFGTVTIALHHKLVTDYEEVFGYKPTEDNAKQHLKDLLDCIEKLTKEVTKHRATLLKSRMALIRDPEESTDLYNPACTAKDAFDNWSMTFYPSVEPEKGAYMPTAQNAVLQRRNQIREQYGSELDELMDQTKTWKYFNPGVTEKYVPQKIRRAVGEFGGISNTVPFSGLDSVRITNITLWYDDKDTLTGLTLGYESKPDVKAGKTSSKFIKLELARDEYISSVYGYMYKHIQGIWFTTQKGRTIGAGKRKRTPFSADLADGLNARLINISGSHNKQLLEKLTFHWEYSY